MSMSLSPASSSSSSSSLVLALFNSWEISRLITSGHLGHAWRGAASSSLWHVETNTKLVVVVERYEILTFMTHADLKEAAVLSPRPR